MLNFENIVEVDVILVVLSKISLIFDQFCFKRRAGWLRFAGRRAPDAFGTLFVSISNDERRIQYKPKRNPSIFVLAVARFVEISKS